MGRLQPLQLPLEADVRLLGGEWRLLLSAVWGRWTGGSWGRSRRDSLDREWTGEGGRLWAE